MIDLWKAWANGHRVKTIFVVGIHWGGKVFPESLRKPFKYHYVYMHTGIYIYICTNKYTYKYIGVYMHLKCELHRHKLI